MPALSQYRNKLAALPSPDCFILIPNYQAEKDYANFAWDVWDDLELAVKARDANDFRGVEFRLQIMRCKMGADAYTAGWMPAVPEGALRSDFPSKLPPPAVKQFEPMPKGEPR